MTLRIVRRYLGEFQGEEVPQTEKNFDEEDSTKPAVKTLKPWEKQQKKKKGGNKKKKQTAAKNKKQVCKQKIKGKSYGEIELQMEKNESGFPKRSNVLNL